MYFKTLILCSRRAILFQRLLPKLGSQGHLAHFCFLLVGNLYEQCGCICRGLGQAWRCLSAAKGIEESKSKIKNGIS